MRARRTVSPKLLLAIGQTVQLYFIGMLHELLSFLAALLWPATVLILTFGFRKSIKRLIESLAELRLLGDKAVLKWPQARVDTIGESDVREPPPLKQLEGDSTPSLNKPADLFWLGSDLETTAQTALRGAPKERILRGLRQSRHHLSELGLGDSPPGRDLAKFSEEVAMLPDAILDRGWRNDFASKIYSVIQAVSGITKTAQPGFRPHPETRASPR
jgi:hypothetical protein